MCNVWLDKAYLLTASQFVPETASLKGSLVCVHFLRIEEALLHQVVHEGLQGHVICEDHLRGTAPGTRSMCR